MMRDTSSLRETQFKKNPKASLYFHDGRFLERLCLEEKWKF